jgi:hypothetical protein
MLRALLLASLAVASVSPLAACGGSSTSLSAEVDRDGALHLVGRGFGTCGNDVAISLPRPWYSQVVGVDGHGGFDAAIPPGREEPVAGAAVASQRRCGDDRATVLVKAGVRGVASTSPELRRAIGAVLAADHGRLFFPRWNGSWTCAFEGGGPAPGGRRGTCTTAASALESGSRVALSLAASDGSWRLTRIFRVRSDGRVRFVRETGSCDPCSVK